MTRYLTSYRFYVLSKVGFCLAYFWVCWDFVRINLALGGQLKALFPALTDEGILGDPGWNRAAVETLLFLSAPAMIWLYALAAPVAAGLFIWGRYRWLQVAVGAWLWLSLIGLTARASWLMSTADFWLNWSFICYVAAGLVTPRGRWEKSQPPASRALWQENPVVASEYALLVVILQFTVYFYAGVNKLHDGWDPWIHGTAIQNLSYDLSMRDYARGMPVPFWISAVLCYVTLFQRLVVPFGFFFMRYRGWAVLILGAMHVGYELLMQVAIFPLVGLAGLLLIVPPRQLALPLVSWPRWKRDERVAQVRKAEGAPAPGFAQGAVMVVVAAILLIEPAVNAVLSPRLPPWNVKLVTMLHWTMFSDGGAFSRVRLRVGLIVYDRQAKRPRFINASALALRCLPDTWRTRFYEQTLLFKATEHQTEMGVDYMKDDYLYYYATATVQLYKKMGGLPVEHVSLRLIPYDQPEPQWATKL